MNNLFAIDVTWVRHGIVGGTESFIINLLNGLMMTNTDFQAILLVAKDNESLFRFVENDERFSIHVCNVDSKYVSKRIMWQNLYLSRDLRVLGCDLCLEPVYAKPILFNKGVKYITVIHDLHALYFPKQLSILTNIWLRISWLNAVKTSYRIVGITDFVVNDIVKRYRIDRSKIRRIYNPIFISDEIEDFSSLEKKYEIEEGKYFYTVSKLNKHKNLSVLIDVMRQLLLDPQYSGYKLVITGPKGSMLNEIEAKAKEYGIENKIVITGFISDGARNSLYENCYQFLFPSIFEGFGMPLIEAMRFGKCVICTDKTCMPEVTQNKAIYVRDPYNVKEWVDCIKRYGSNDGKVCGIDFSKYLPNLIAQEYLSWILS